MAPVYFWVIVVVVLLLYVYAVEQLRRIRVSTEASNTLLERQTEVLGAMFARGGEKGTRDGSIRA